MRIWAIGNPNFLRFLGFDALPQLGFGNRHFSKVRHLKKKTISYTTLCIDINVKFSVRNPNSKFGDESSISEIMFDNCKSTSKI